jgi:alkanesulfonate monooxygenase SsuD/methylene tetrahydromethanopterin reductase-like flavin-dependent oxidoreductase (luciferase family)
MVKFGLRIPEFAVDGSSAPALIEQDGRALEAGRGRFASAWMSDHFLPWDAFGGGNTIPNLESWTSMTYLAAQHPSYTFGQIVLSQSYRPPALLAKMAATLQTLSGGRFVLGLGAGWKEDEYRAYGYAFPPAAVRIQQLAEAAQILKLMWTEPAATFHGQHYHIDNAVCEPRPATPIPLLIGGSGRKLTLRVVARYADWWNGGGAPEQYAEVLAALRGHCRDVGRDYDSIVKTWVGDCVAVAPTSAAAQQMAAASPFYNRDSAIVGTPAEVVTQLRRLTDLGVEHFILRFADFPRTEGITLFGEEVIGAFAA